MGNTPGKVYNQSKKHGGCISYGLGALGGAAISIGIRAAFPDIPAEAYVGIVPTAMVLAYAAVDKILDSAIMHDLRRNNSNYKD